MGNIVVILLIVTVALLPVKALILYAVFNREIRQWWDARRHPEPASTPACIYCRSSWTIAVDDGHPRWEDDALVLVTTYECQHCRLPFWHVERVPIGAAQR